jgi:hypothetical protein
MQIKTTVTYDDREIKMVKINTNNTNADEQLNFQTLLGEYKVLQPL